MKITRFSNPNQLIQELNQLSTAPAWDKNEITLDKLKTLFLLNGSLLYTETDEETAFELQKNLHALRVRISIEFTTEVGKQLAREIYDIAGKILNFAKQAKTLKAASLKIYGCQNAKEAVQCVIDYELTSANLEEFPDVLEEDLERLAIECPNLETLIIKNSQIKALPISKLKNLNSLKICSCKKISREALAETLSELTQLQELVLSDCHRIATLNNSNVIEQIGNLRNLEILNLSGSSQFPGEAFGQSIEKLTRLKILDLSRCKFYLTHRIANHLAKLTKLISLNLSKCYMNEETLASALAPLVKLQSLDLTGCCDNGGERLAKVLCKLRDLRELNLSKCKELSEDDFIEVFENLINLRALKLSHWKSLYFLEDIAQAFEKLTALEYLDLSFCEQLEGNELHTTLCRLLNIKYLNLIGCPKLPKETHEKIYNLSQSRKIDFKSDPVPKGSNAKEIVQFVIDYKLTSADLRGCVNLQEEDLERLAKECPNLEKLIIEDAAIKTLPISNLKNLKHLEITSCDDLTGDEIALGLSGLTQLQVLVISNCPQMNSKSKFLSLLTNLEILDLSRSGSFSGYQLAKSLLKLTKLKILNLQMTNVIHSHLLVAPIAQLHQLQILVISTSEKLSRDFGLHLRDALPNLQKLIF